MAKSLDLTGKRFGHLVVVGRAENNNRGNTQWNCVCDCGGTKVALGYDLNNGRTTTCGCKLYLAGKPSRNRISLVGNKYGRLTVTSLNEGKSKNGVLVWNCVCECGNTFTARGSNLKSGKATHCGCVPKLVAARVISPWSIRVPNDLTGKRFGRLVVTGIESRGNKRINWMCKCDCGGEKIATTNSLTSGHTQSCGCLLSESRRRNASKHWLENMDIPTDPDTYRRLRVEFASMHRRCSNKYCKPHIYYDRGIRVCEAWNDFNVFLSWAIESGYRNDLTLDRIDVDGNYCPENCRWITLKEQQNNKRNNVFVTIGDETKTVAQWSEIYGLIPATVRQRIKRGWPQEKWFIPPTNGK